MRLHILSDLHLEMAPFAVPSVEADAVVLAGDLHQGHEGLLWIQQTFPNKPVISNLEHLIGRSGANLWIHGHIHGASDYRVGGTRVLSNPRGYPGEVAHGFKPALVIEV